jgi:hypothetical protein
MGALARASAYKTDGGQRTVNHHRIGNRFPGVVYARSPHQVYVRKCPRGDLDLHGGEISPIRENFT